MIELEKVFQPISKALNECYKATFPDLCRNPQFSFMRAMIILWRKKVYSKIKNNLIEAFVHLLKTQREREIKKGQMKSKERTLYFTPFLEEKGGLEQLARYIQTIADLSVNEVTIHYIGSTKVKLYEPYIEVSKVIIKQTK